MLKISYADFPGLSPMILAQFVFVMCLTDQSSQKIYKNSCFGVQGHPRTLLMVSIKMHVRLPISD